MTEVSGNKFTDYKTEKAEFPKKIEVAAPAETKEVKNEQKEKKEEHNTENKNEARVFDDGNFNPVTKQFPMHFSPPHNLSAIKDIPIDRSALVEGAQAELNLIERMKGNIQKVDGELRGIKHK